jgi:hypothetical protein
MGKGAVHSALLTGSTGRGIEGENRLARTRSIGPKVSPCYVRLLPEGPQRCMAMSPSRSHQAPGSDAPGVIIRSFGILCSLPPVVRCRDIL